MTAWHQKRVTAYKLEGPLLVAPANDSGVGSGEQIIKKQRLFAFVELKYDFNDRSTAKVTQKSHTKDWRRWAKHFVRLFAFFSVKA